MKRIFQRIPFFHWLLPVFFVLHGYTAHYNFIPLGAAGLLTGLYLFATVFFFGLSWLFFRDTRKAALFAFCVMSVQFFFGAVHDSLRSYLPGTLFVKYAFLLPVIFAGLLLLVILLKKTSRKFARLSFYLNVLTLIIIAADGIGLLVKTISHDSKTVNLPVGFKACDSCNKPDIYFILADEYAGNEALQTVVGFDNTDFIGKLDTIGFKTIEHSFSNYNYTPFSMASILNMDYLRLADTNRAGADLTYSYKSIKDNKVLTFLEMHGYEFYNYSVFDFEGQPARVRETFLPAKTRLITSQTLLSRFNNEIRFNLVSRWKSKSNLKILTYANKHNNENIYRLTSNIAHDKSMKPKFVYTHLMMPHYPYYFDKDGREQPFESLLEDKQFNVAAYREYLQYANKRLITLISHILSTNETPPVIILMGDHGFRHVSSPVARKYYFSNLASIYFPGRNYSNFPDSITGVNVFRRFLNSEFKQALPYLQDSLIYLRD